MKNNILTNNMVLKIKLIILPFLLINNSYCMFNNINRTFDYENDIPLNEDVDDKSNKEISILNDSTTLIPCFLEPTDFSIFENILNISKKEIENKKKDEFEVIQNFNLDNSDIISTKKNKNLNNNNTTENVHNNKKLTVIRHIFIQYIQYIIKCVNEKFSNPEIKCNKCLPFIDKTKFKFTFLFGGIISYSFMLNFFKKNIYIKDFLSLLFYTTDENISFDTLIKHIEEGNKHEDIKKLLNTTFSDFYENEIKNKNILFKEKINYKNNNFFNKNNDLEDLNKKDLKEILNEIKLKPRKGKSDKNKHTNKKINYDLFKEFVTENNTEEKFFDFLKKKRKLQNPRKHNDNSVRNLKK